jgi:hypothetical protein
MKIQIPEGSEIKYIYLIWIISFWVLGLIIVYDLYIKPDHESRRQFYIETAFDTLTMCKGDRVCVDSVKMNFSKCLLESHVVKRLSKRKEKYILKQGEFNECIRGSETG